MQTAKENVEALDRRVRTLKKKIEETDTIFQRKKAGDALEQNQLAKLSTRKAREDELQDLERKRRDLLVAAGPEVCASFGVCSNCGIPAHDAKNCPRPKNPLANQSNSTQRPLFDRHVKAGSNPTRKPSKSGNGECSQTTTSLSDALPVDSMQPRAIGKPESHRKERLPQSRSSADEDAVQSGHEVLPRILCVAEKPSVAKALAQTLSGGRQRIRMNVNGHAPMCKLHDFYHHFSPANSKCSVTVTSVLGHVHALDFDFDSSNHGDPANLYGAAVKKVVEDSTAEHGIEEHLVAAAAGCNFLYLWLDCDREGENICYEVISICRAAGLFLSDDQIFRARFSALTEIHIKAAWHRPEKPDPRLSQAVDARQEMDLKVGVSFTRLLTHQLLAAAKVRFAKCAPRLRLISYGPCQTPTLYFCVRRQRQIAAFVPRAYYSLVAHVVSASTFREPLELEWSVGRVWEKAHAQQALARCLNGRRQGQACWRARVKAVSTQEREMAAPLGLNTVALLTNASNRLGFSPAHTMTVAERLYMAGHLSYPRTESTRYPEDRAHIEGVLREHARHPIWGAHAGDILAACEAGEVVMPPRRGVDVGDHPPIMPTRCAARPQVHGNDDWRLYELVARHWLASLSPSLDYREHQAQIAIGADSDEEMFTYTWQTIPPSSRLHFAAVMPWRLASLRLRSCSPFPLDQTSWPADAAATPDPNPPGRPTTRGRRGGGRHEARRSAEGTSVEVKDVSMIEGMTSPPGLLKEAELVAEMDANGIGTDASIPTHITNIVQRSYVRVTDASGAALPQSPDSGPSCRRHGGGGGGGEGGGGRAGGGGGHVAQSRHLEATELGMALIDAFETVDSSLVTPQVRAAMEQQVALIAKGQADKGRIVELNLALFLEKFLTFRGSLPVIYPLFSDPEHQTDGVPGCKASALARMPEWQQRKAEQELDLQSAVADAQEKRRLLESRAAAARRFAPASLEQDLLACLFGGAQQPVAASQQTPALPHSAADGAGVMTAWARTVAGGGAREGGASEELERLRAMVIKGETRAVSEAWSASGATDAARGGTRRGRGRGRGRTPDATVGSWRGNRDRGKR